MALTPEQKVAYLRSPDRCPYCGSTGIEASAFDYDDNWVAQKVACLACNQKWQDLYTLADVEEIRG